MSASVARAVFERYLAAVNGGDANALDDVLHPDFQDFYPQSGERTRGAENLKHIIRSYPGGYEDLGRGPVLGAEDRWVTTPMFTLLRIDGTGSGVHRHPEGALTQAEKRRAIGRHWEVAGRDETAANEIYHDDVVCRDPLRQ